MYKRTEPPIEVHTPYKSNFLVFIVKCEITYVPIAGTALLLCSVGCCWVWTSSFDFGWLACLLLRFRRYRLWKQVSPSKAACPCLVSVEDVQWSFALMVGCAPEELRMLRGQYPSFLGRACTREKCAFNASINSVNVTEFDVLGLFLNSNSRL